MSELDLLCQRLKELRKRHNLTQEEFAQIASMSYKHYQKIESGGKKQIWLETVSRLASAYSLETWQLIGPETPKRTKIAYTPAPSKVHYK